MRIGGSDATGMSRHRTNIGTTRGNLLERLAQRVAGPILIAFPLLAVLGPYASLSPGHAGHVYFNAFLAWLSIAPAAVLWLRSDALKHAPPKWYLLFTAVWIVWPPITLRWAPSHAAGLREINGSIWCIVAGLVAIALTQGRASRLAAMRAGWIVAFVATTAIAVWEMVTHHHLISSVGYKWAFTADTVVTTFKNPNDYAWFLLACLSVFMLGVMRARTKVVRSLYGLLTALSGLLIVPSRSRGAFGVVALFALLSAFWLWERAGRPAGRTVAKAAIASAAVLISLMFTPPGEDIRSRVMASFQGTALSDTHRVQLILAGVRYFIKSHGIGAGAGAYEPKIMHDPQAHVGTLVNAHNTFIEMLSQYGVIATVPFLAIFAAVILAVLRSRRVAGGRSLPLLDLRMHLLMILLVIVDAGVVSSSVLTDTTWWMLIAYATALGWQLSRASAKAQTEHTAALAAGEDQVLQDAV